MHLINLNGRAGSLKKQRIEKVKNDVTTAALFDIVFNVDDLAPGMVVARMIDGSPITYNNRASTNTEHWQIYFLEQKFLNSEQYRLVPFDPVQARFINYRKPVLLNSLPKDSVFVPVYYLVLGNLNELKQAFRISCSKYYAYDDEGLMRSGGLLMVFGHSANPAKGIRDIKTLEKVKPYLIPKLEY